MLILLPPSEGKAVPKRGKALDLHQLTAPALAPAREQVLDRLVDLCADEVAARGVLGLTAGQADDLRHNAALRTAPTAAARGVYTGVLYEALNLATLPARAASKLLIFSGLWGIVRPGDRIPTYRCSIGVNLPGVGVLGTYWRKHLAEPVADLAGRGVVLDLRSSAYAGAWVPVDNRRVVTVRVVQERMVDGAPVRAVVSHFNKATKGRLVRELLVAGAQPRTPSALITALRELGYTVESPAPRQVDVVVTDL